MASMVDHLRVNAPLRRMVVIDLALALVIPTQLVSLILSSKDLPELTSMAIASAMTGFLLARLVLFWRGFRDRARTVLLVTTVALLAMQLFAVIALEGDWLLRSPIPLNLSIVVASVMCAYSVGFTASAIQKGVPEDFRGQLSGALVAGRCLLIAGAALVSAAAAALLGPREVVLILAGALTLLILLSRGFRGLTVPS
jgi:hypothetical protein